jgi:hypothetical protein
MAYSMSDKLSALRQQQQNRISEYIPPETAAQNGQLREEISETLDNVRQLQRTVVPLVPCWYFRAVQLNNAIVLQLSLYIRTLPL